MFICGEDKGLDVVQKPGLNPSRFVDRMPQDMQESFSQLISEVVRGKHHAGQQVWREEYQKPGRNRWRLCEVELRIAGADVEKDGT